MGGNNWLICGTSPYIVTDRYNGVFEPKIHEHKLERLLKLMAKCTTVGLNYFPLKCDYRFVMDCGHVLPTYKNGERLVIPRELLPELRCYNSVGRESLLIEPYYTYDLGRELSCINSVCFEKSIFVLFFIILLI
jgi:hypothetical protein